MASDAPLPAGLPFDQQLDLLRALYTQGSSDIMDHALSHVLLPADQEMLCIDAGQFLIFQLVIKTMANYREEPTLSNAMRHFRKMVQNIEKEVPGMVQEYLREFRQMQAGTTNQASQED